jgi:hypothetical protein
MGFWLGGGEKKITMCENLKSRNLKLGMYCLNYNVQTPFLNELQPLTAKRLMYVK